MLRLPPYVDGVTPMPNQNYLSRFALPQTAIIPEVDAPVNYAAGRKLWISRKMTRPSGNPTLRGGAVLNAPRPPKRDLSTCGKPCPEPIAVDRSSLAGTGSGVLPRHGGRYMSRQRPVNTAERVRGPHRDSQRRGAGASHGLRTDAPRHTVASCPADGRSNGPDRRVKDPGLRSRQPQERHCRAHSPDASGNLANQGAPGKRVEAPHRTTRPVSPLWRVRPRPLCLPFQGGAA